jgi:sugar phosphate permease
MERDHPYLLSLSYTQFAWFVVLLLWISHAIYFFNYSGLGVLGPIVKQEMGLSNAQFGLLFSTIFMGAMLIQIPAGMWCDRFGVRRVMSYGLLLIGISLLFFSLNRSFFFNYVIVSLLGIGTGLSQISAAKSIIDWFPFKGRATAMGLKQTGINAGGILASLLLPFLIKGYPWRVVLGFIGVATLCYAFLFFLLYRDAPEMENLSEKKKFHIREVLILLKRKDFLIVTISGISLMAVQFSYSSYLILYLNQQLHYTIELSGIFLALSFGLGAFARVGWSMGSDYLLKSRKRVLIIIGIWGAMVNVFFSLTSSSTPSWMIYILAISFGLTGMGWNAVFITLIGELSLRESAGLGIGSSFFLISFGALLGPPFFGLLVDLFSSFLWSWLFLAFCMFLVSLLFSWVTVKSKTNSVNQAYR